MLYNNYIDNNDHIVSYNNLDIDNKLNEIDEILKDINLEEISLSELQKLKISEKCFVVLSHDFEYFLKSKSDKPLINKIKELYTYYNDLKYHNQILSSLIENTNNIYNYKINNFYIDSIKNYDLKKFIGIKFDDFNIENILINDYITNYISFNYKDNILDFSNKELYNLKDKFYYNNLYNKIYEELFDFYIIKNSLVLNFIKILSNIKEIFLFYTLIMNFIPPFLERVIYEIKNIKSYYGNEFNDLNNSIQYIIKLYNMFFNKEEKIIDNSDMNSLLNSLFSLEEIDLNINYNFEDIDLPIIIYNNKLLFTFKYDKYYMKMIINKIGLNLYDITDSLKLLNIENKFTNILGCFYDNNLNPLFIKNDNYYKILNNKNLSYIESENLSLEIIDEYKKIYNEIDKNINIEKELKYVFKTLYKYNDSNVYSEPIIDSYIENYDNINKIYLEYVNNLKNNFNNNDIDILFSEDKNYEYKKINNFQTYFIGKEYISTNDNIFDNVYNKMIDYFKNNSLEDYNFNNYISNLNENNILYNILNSLNKNTLLQKDFSFLSINSLYDNINNILPYNNTFNDEDEFFKMYENFDIENIHNINNEIFKILTGINSNNYSDLYENINIINKSNNYKNILNIFNTNNSYIKNDEYNTIIDIINNNKFELSNPGDLSDLLNLLNNTNSHFETQDDIINFVKINNSIETTNYNNNIIIDKLTFLNYLYSFNDSLDENIDNLQLSKLFLKRSELLFNVFFLKNINCILNKMKLPNLLLKLNINLEFLNIKIPDLNLSNIGNIFKINLNDLIKIKLNLGNLFCISDTILGILGKGLLIASSLKMLFDSMENNINFFKNSLIDVYNEFKQSFTPKELYNEMLKEIKLKVNDYYDNLYYTYVELKNVGLSFEEVVEMLYVTDFEILTEFMKLKLDEKLNNFSNNLINSFINELINSIKISYNTDCINNSFFNLDNIKLPDTKIKC